MDEVTWACFHEQATTAFENWQRTRYYDPVDRAVVRYPKEPIIMF